MSRKKSPAVTMLRNIQASNNVQAATQVMWLMSTGWHCSPLLAYTQNLSAITKSMSFRKCCQFMNKLAALQSPCLKVCDD